MGQFFAAYDPCRGISLSPIFSIYKNRKLHHSKAFSIFSMYCFHRLEYFGFWWAPLIKRFISVYSDGALIPFGVTVSPRLDVSISHPNLIFKTNYLGVILKGFPCDKTMVTLGETPFLELKLGPSVVKDYAPLKE